MPCLRRAVSCAEGSSSPRDAQQDFRCRNAVAEALRNEYSCVLTPLRALRYPAKPRRRSRQPTSLMWEARERALLRRE